MSWCTRAGDTLRVGFIGVGRHASTSVYPALRPAGLQLVATCATDADRARAHARTFGAEAGYDSVDQLLARDDLDAVLVSVPPERYREIVVDCLSAGLPVFTEKPGGADLDDLMAIESESERTGRVVMVGYMKRFARAYRTARSFVESPDFGPVTSLHMKFVMGPFGSLRHYLVDNPVHALDLLRFFGGEVTDLEVRSKSWDESRHGLSLLLEFEGGAVGTAQLGTTGSFHQENELLEVVGLEHSATVTNVDTAILRGPTGAVLMDRPTYTVPLKPNFSGDTMGFVPELEHFREVVIDGTPCESDIGSARRTLELAERVWEGVAARGS